MKSWGWLALGLAALGALATACGGDDDDSADPGTGGAAPAAGGGSGGGMAGASGATPSGGATGGGAAGSGGAGNSGPFIVLDQFGYLPTSEKIAVLRDPQTGFDASDEFTPSASYSVVDSATEEVVFTAAPTAWDDGAEHAASGDRAWWFDFSSVTTPGEYYVVDEARQLRSPTFRIGDDVYRDVLKHAVRTFFYQRAGFAKTAEYAGEGWADEASHLGPRQDAEARLFSSPDDASTARDLQGGWYDAGDYNKYTNWTARYVIELLRAAAESPLAFGDDFGIPESGNDVPDVIDEAKWGMDWLVRMQNEDGSVLSIVGLDGASPPSSADGPSLYGPASTSATLSTAAAFAFGARALASYWPEYAADLETRAVRAWAWASTNPEVTFRNNDAAEGSEGLGAGQQEVDEYGRLVKRVEAAVYLFEITGEAAYQSFVDDNYESLHFMEWSWASPFQTAEQEALLHYAALPSATASVAEAIRGTFTRALQGEDNFGAVQTNADAYLAFIKDYTWGSNATQSNQGNQFLDLVRFSVDTSARPQAEAAALRHVHYLHGTNPLGLVYLSNMAEHGAEHSVNEFYHTWFGDGSEAWDRVGTSTYGPPPGFLTGGPNPSYDWDGCCPDSCGSAENSARCTSEPIEPPKGQPAQKSYKDFNTSWPLNSWAVTENSNGYQTAYIRLLAHFAQ